MRRHNTTQELQAINKHIRTKSTKLIYCSSRNSKYKGTWISFKACRRTVPIDNSDTENTFYSLKHPGNSVKVFCLSQ